MTDLGRPWRPYASVTFINCELADHIKPEGWSIWVGNQNHLTARYAEYHSTGPGANPDKRLAWTHQLTSEQAGKITIDAVLGGGDHWNPQANSSAAPTATTITQPAPRPN
jgi:pectinesterase